MSDVAPFPDVADARIAAALDQLTAALTDATGERISDPLVVIAFVPEHEGLSIFSAGLPGDDAVAALLLGAHENLTGREPDQTRHN